jgi:hypothetical protein
MSSAIDSGISGFEQEFCWALGMVRFSVIGNVGLVSGLAVLAES